jgi:hypothetical protein
VSRTGRTARQSAATATVAAFLVAVAAMLGACTGSSGGGSPTTSAKPSGSGGAGGGTPLSRAAVQVEQQYLPARRPAALASVAGKVRDGSGTMVSGTVDILSVLAGPGSTAVRLRLATDQPIQGVSTNYYQVDEHHAPDISGVALLAPTANLRLLPGIWSGSEPASDNCTCSKVPGALGPEGVELSAVYPALPANVTQVQLKVRGFPALSAPVTRG